MYSPSEPRSRPEYSDTCFISKCEYLAVGRRALGLEQDFSVPSDQLSPEILVQPPSIAHEAPVLLGGLLADAQGFTEDLEVLGILGGVGPRVLLLQGQPVVHAARSAVRSLGVDLDHLGVNLTSQRRPFRGLEQQYAAPLNVVVVQLEQHPDWIHHGAHAITVQLE